MFEDDGLDRRFAAGEAAAVREAYERHGRLVFSLCLTALRSREDAEDAAHRAGYVNQRSHTMSLRSALRGALRAEMPIEEWAEAALDELPENLWRIARDTSVAETATVVETAAAITMPLMHTLDLNAAAVAGSDGTVLQANWTWATSVLDQDAIARLNRLWFEALQGRIIAAFEMLEDEANGPFAEIVQPGLNGELVQPGDAPALAAAVSAPMVSRPSA